MVALHSARQGLTRAGVWRRAGVQRHRNWMRGPPISPDRIMGMSLHDVRNSSALYGADSDAEFDPKNAIPPDVSTTTEQGKEGNYAGTTDRRGTC